MAMQEMDSTEGIAFVLPKSRKYFGRSNDPHQKIEWRQQVEKMAIDTTAVEEDGLHDRIKELERLHQELLNMIQTLDSYLDDPDP